MSESHCRSVVPEKYRLQLQPRHLSAGFLDVYDILELTGVQDKELDHAAKKILCSGRRNKGSKRQDVEEAIVALKRYLERNEEAPKPEPLPDCMKELGLTMEEWGRKPLDKIGAYLNADSIRYDWGEDDRPVRVENPGGDLLEGTSPLCAHGFNFESCDRCWHEGPYQLAPGGYGGVFADIPPQPLPTLTSYAQES